MIEFNSKLNRDDFTQEELERFRVNVGNLSYQYREKIKHLYFDYGQNMPLEYKLHFAKLILLAYYLRSLEASEFSPQHADFGTFAASIMGQCDFNDEEIEKALRDGYGERPELAEELMPVGESYWDWR